MRMNGGRQAGKSNHPGGRPQRPPDQHSIHGFPLHNLTCAGFESWAEKIPPLQTFFFSIFLISRLRSGLCRKGIIVYGDKNILDFKGIYTDERHWCKNAAQRKFADAVAGTP
ncbi:hypothetical protein [Novosphingobium terrae]|uniref:hypothetical protein n=1 Tax=Novosphingobium terrae TaxID=2726189 RepID=UPI00197F7BDC|nr:hypothetical protein [Novosphingobium terrae]